MPRYGLSTKELRQLTFPVQYAYARTVLIQSRVCPECAGDIKEKPVLHCENCLLDISRFKENPYAR